MDRFCSNCGKEIEENTSFCSNCGKNLAVNSYHSEFSDFVEDGQSKTKKSSGTASLVCGIVGLFVAGIILGIISLVLAGNTKRDNNGVHTSQSKAGFILGIIDIIGGVLATIINLSMI